jgi:hypothetical protein
MPMNLLLFTKRLFLPLVITLSLFFCGGCATIVKGTHQIIPVSSDPSGAAVLVDGQRMGSSPTTLNLSRKVNHVVTIESEGYEVENIAISRSIGGAVAGNIVAGGFIGWGVDAATGAQYNLYPESINVRLRKKERSVEKTAAFEVSGLLSELGKLETSKKEGKISAKEYPKLREAILKRYQ